MDSLAELLTALRDNHLRVRREKSETVHETIVQYVTTIHGLTSVKIFAPTAERVIQEIDRAMQAVEREGGMANFRGPLPIPNTGGGFGAVGEIFP